MLTRKAYLVAMATTLALAVSGGSRAQGNGEPPPDEQEPSFEALLKLVSDVMPPVITDERNSDLVRNLMNVQLAKTPLADAFKPTVAFAEIFGPRVRPNLDRDCLRTQTPAGVPSEDNCTASLGEADSRVAPYTALEFSKNMGFGNIRLLKRPASSELPTKPEDLKPVNMDNAEVYAMGLDWLGRTFGLPVQEEVQIPPNQRVVPVSDLQVGFDPRAQIPPITIQKVVHLRRGLKLETPLKDPVSGTELTHVSGPGMASVAFDASGQVVGAMVKDWQALAPNPDVKPDLAKTKSELVNEIARDLANVGGGPIGSVKILIGLSTDFQGTQGRMLPAVQVFVQPGGADEEQAPKGPTTGAYVREYLLVNIPEGDEPKDR